ncbi:required for respiratory growth 1, mitochondrial [Gossypium arboreum]|uniref:Required for respiratory growth 1, mitochondrial n=1 Tax=Gossypium arboreum TaxID=29729 RepID=A0A0B0PBY1_GOSAR|nr:required for respiratory growth 1, mitochondrial [Gossypium arboreum]
MALISYYKVKVPCKTMPRHGIGEYIWQGYHVRPCRDMAMVSFKRIPCKTMTSHGNGAMYPYYSK